MAETTENPTSSTAEEDVIPGYKTLGDFTRDGFSCLIQGIKHANALPSGRDWDFYNNFESFKQALNDESEVIMDGMTSLLKKQDVGCNIRHHTSNYQKNILLQANDIILGRVAINIDVLNGIRSAVNEPVILQSVSAELPLNINGSWNRSIGTKVSMTTSVGTVPVLSTPQARGNIIRLLTAENIVRPQKMFKDKIDNRNDYAWEPRIKDKPNSLKPLAIFLEQTEKGNQFCHPYEYELDRFTPSDNFLNKTKIIKPKLLKDTPLIEISTPEKLPGLVEDLMKFKTIAVDLEHHSYRSFMGITCLMQISTPETDYLIDTLALRNDLWILNEVFTKPDITKVFHGAESDILWLQRDLSLYIVNMFDTYFASKLLDYSGLSLAYLMQRFCKFVPNKKFQLADWRIRPLPDELKTYAREDTHYLIYIYQNMRNELIDRANGKTNLLKSVIDSSKALCLKRYVKPFWNDDSHLELYRRCRRMFDNKQLYAFKHLYKWRDNIARQEDESTGYVLPNNMLLEISERLPREMQGILGCCNPIPPLVKSNLLELHKILLKAIEQPFEEPILKEDTRAKGSTKIMTKINVDSSLYCPHDLTKNKDFRENLPTLLNSDREDPEALIQNDFHLEKQNSILSVFRISKILDTEKESQASAKLRKFKENFNFLGPFERYRLVKPFIEARQKKLAEEKAKQEEKEKAKKEAESNASNIIDDDQDTRTDEERIESIRQHFLSLARQTLPPSLEPPNESSLLEVGATIKRKREGPKLPDTNKHQTSENQTTTSPFMPFNPAQEDADEHKKVPNKKRKIADDDSSVVPKLSRREKNKMKMDKRKHKRALAQQSNEESFSGNNSFQNMKGRGPRGGGGHVQRGSGKGNRGRGGKSNKNKNSNNPQRPNQPEEFNSYDYSMVDFRQFQGGARGVEKGKEFKTQYRGRGKPNKRGGKNQNNRAMTFGGRGRGR
ncbi:unnamed protein product [Ceutorhynchus assimilis]|uniref:Exosome complex component 10 homolog n=1 Tax=Ceutorhynchus assimilis TaxID=467358 RepID=A0A9P0DEQ1_9CUCU|nr:unnamed protein product [Ceutorhynchus assimilis]